jgi:sterol-4alpha-carboxylate 3-dehydrogenase (decarboxylating)
MIEPVMGVLEDGMTNIWMGYNEIFMDNVYVGHVAEAEILAVKGLLAEIDNPNAPKVGGEAFNITDDEPYPPFTFFRKLWIQAGDRTPLSSGKFSRFSLISRFMSHPTQKPKFN